NHITQQSSPAFMEMEHVTFLIVLVDSTVKLTEKMKLDCVYPKKATIIQTSWMKNNLTHKEYIAVLHPVYGIYITDNYKGRIHFQNDSSEDSSLYFIKSTLKDVGVYCCSIQTFPDGTWEKVIKIVQPDVFEVPERQNNHVLTKPEENVTFTCPYNIGGPVQQVMWERIKVDQMDFIVLCNSLGQKSFGSDFEERALVDCTSKTSTMMVLQNVTASDFAMYRCVVTGRNKTFAMSFIVTDTLPNSSNIFLLLVQGNLSSTWILQVIPSFPNFKNVLWKISVETGRPAVV
uniref:Ig-like domain-containing protein n=1 Tax=Nothoprocta perdicaria TaxID=30464 RepID=A0A8C6Z795_NOTPE